MGAKMAHEIKVPEDVEKTYKNIKLTLKRIKAETLPNLYLYNPYVYLVLSIPEKNIEINTQISGYKLFSTRNIKLLARKTCHALNEKLFAHDLQLEEGVINIITEMLQEYKQGLGKKPWN
jgi:hypothetical protein